jgi:hypothetical protein
MSSSSPRAYLLSKAAPVSVRASLLDVRAVHIEGRLVTPTAENEVVELQFTLPMVNALWWLDDRKLFALFPWEVVIDKVEGKGKNTRLVELRVGHLLVYSFADAHPLPEADDLDHFVALGAQMHAWPYLRAETQSLSSKLGLPALVLPVRTAAEASMSVLVRRQPIPTAEQPEKKPRLRRRAGS